MPENYEVTSVREITDVSPESGDLLDYIEADAKTKPHGVHFSVRAATSEGGAQAVTAALAAKAAELESVFGTD